MNIADKLDRLLAAFQAQGLDPQLRPGATETELDQLEEALQLTLPEDLRALWAWRNGHSSHPPPFPHVFAFHRKAFIGTPEVLHVRNDVLAYLTEDEEWHQNTFDTAKCIPFANLNAGTVTVSCGPQGDAPHLQHSIVDLHGEMNTSFESIEKMIDTSIEICLLYTSPSPRDATLSRMPSSA